ncbi:hypothetical protein DFQ14_1239 [Halopolyspora algeriensis]|uniref:Uncharacterized protein n=1 Tax=Halopolyspora algeriensis TaxID=1500506 RepID=A0A368VBE9_9ACTN|nr:hypothetical protein [Halopolyspora algeriensis]RCW38442.1 hypothetical protein DFQ14_1239 [Halopolyspora algeriensis]TQM55757.1 hypothetical protein FHU43_0533 [Halopolyspora algeriensis]
MVLTVGHLETGPVGTVLESRRLTGVISDGDVAWNLHDERLNRNISGRLVDTH